MRARDRELEIRGRINMAAGGATIGRGVGFTATRTAVGRCTIRFDRPFVGPPDVTANGDATAAARIVQVNSIDSRSVEILVFTDANVLTDTTADFDFHARGRVA